MSRTGCWRMFAFCPDSKSILIADWEEEAVIVWRLDGGKPAEEYLKLRGHGILPQVMAMSPDNRWIAAGGFDGPPWLWDLRAPEPGNPILLGEETGSDRVAFSSNSCWVVTQLLAGPARIWDLKSGDPSKAFFLLAGNESFVTAVEFSPDAKRVATGSEDGTVHVWDLHAPFPFAQSVLLHGHQNLVGSIVFSPDGHWVATGSCDKTVCLSASRMEDLLALARRVGGRNLSAKEAQTFLPGGSSFEVFPGLPTPNT